jgi:DNA-binding winged helix-turn-helix (wHTH) protein/tetratricopeptide (TPR) repeat protein
MSADPEEITFRSWRVRPQLREIEGPSGTVRVKPKSMDVFLALLRRPRQLRSKDELLAEVWKDASVNEEVLTQAVAELRRAFGDDPRSPEIIDTVFRAGYRLLVAPRMEATDESISPGAAGQLSTFVGREREREKLVDALNRAERGSGSVILLSGEPGIGKTRLAGEALSLARSRHFMTLMGRCSEEAETPPMLPFVEIVERAARVVPRELFRSVLGESGPVIARMVPGLRREFPDLPPPAELPPEQQRRYLFNSFLDFLQRHCELGPVCLLVDDLQWADDGSALLLQHVAPEVGRLRLLILGTLRETELRETSAIRRVIEDLTRQRRATRLTLAALPTSDVGQLLECLSGARPPDAVVDLFVRATDGNPFFVEELHSHTVERQDTGRSAGDWWRTLPLPEIDVPEGVRTVTRQRVSRLGNATRSFLSAAAVVGRVFDPLVVHLLTSRADRERLLSAVDEAERAGMVSPKDLGRGLRYEFTHDLIRHALLADLSEARRREMHGQVVASMEELYPDVEAYAAEVVAHLESAGDAADADRMRRYSIRAAESALEAAASEDALRHVDRALALLANQDHRTRARLLFLRGYTLRSLLRWEEASRDWLAAIPLFEELGDRDSLARTCKDMAIMAQWRNRSPEAIGLAERGLALVGEAPTRQRAQLLCHAGVGHGGARRFEEGDRILAEAEAVARYLQDSECLGAVLFYRSISAMFQMRVEEQLVLAERSVELLRGTTNLWDFVPALEFVHMAWFSLGRWREMAAWEPEIERIAERLGHVGTTLLLQHTRAYRKLLESPNLDIFGAAAKAHLEGGDRTGLPLAQIQGRVDLGQVAWWRGDFTEAEAILREATTREFEAPGLGTAFAAHMLLLARLGDLRALDGGARSEPGRQAGMAPGSCCWPQWRAWLFSGRSIGRRHCTPSFCTRSRPPARWCRSGAGRPCRA